MDFVSNSEVQIQEMLESMGITSIEELFHSIPSSLFHSRLTCDDGLSEAEVLQWMENLGAKNSYSMFESYLGAGAYHHYVPALVSAITSRSEFLTSYTPYQAEISQGGLQAIFEFQSAYAALTGLDASNASVYDGASACAEAVLMALRLTKKRSIALSQGLHPLYRRVVELYLEGLDVEIAPLSSSSACLLVQSPNFFGIIEEMPTLALQAHEQGALFIACGNPLSYGLLKCPGDYNADIAVGDCQPLGLPLSYGGPYAGYMTCKKDLIRQLPGRIVGETIDSNGEKGYILTLQAREQHIRREKATSNICTNQALAALSSLITLLWYGPIGLKKLALTNYQRAHYLSQELEKIPGFSIEHPFFNEFTLKVPCVAEEAEKHFRKAGIIPGLQLKKFYPHLSHHLLVSVTELKTMEALKKFISTAKEL